MAMYGKIQLHNAASEHMPCSNSSVDNSGSASGLFFNPCNEHSDYACEIPIQELEGLIEVGEVTWSLSALRKFGDRQLFCFLQFHLNFKSV